MGTKHVVVHAVVGAAWTSAIICMWHRLIFEPFVYGCVVLHSRWRPIESLHVLRKELTCQSIASKISPLDCVPSSTGS